MTAPIIFPVYNGGPTYEYDDPCNPNYPWDGVYTHSRWTRRREGRKLSNWYQDPKLANYLVFEDLRARPRKFEWDPEPCLAFGGKKYPMEPMPRKVTWRATGDNNYHDLGRGGCIPLPRKSAEWRGPDNLGPRATELKAARAAVAGLKAAQAAQAPSTSAEGSRHAPAAKEAPRTPDPKKLDPDGRRARKAREKRREKRERDRAFLAELERRNQRAWAAIHMEEEREAIMKQRKRSKAEETKADQEAAAAKEKVARDLKQAERELKRAEKAERKKQKLEDMARKKHLKQQAKQKAKDEKTALKNQMAAAKEAERTNKKVTQVNTTQNSVVAPATSSAKVSRPEATPVTDHAPERHTPRQIIPGVI